MLEQLIFGHTALYFDGLRKITANKYISEDIYIFPFLMLYTLYCRQRKPISFQKLTMYQIRAIFAITQCHTCYLERANSSSPANVEKCSQVSN